MDFESFAKLWPHQLDLLSGPLLEGDDDDDMDNAINNELISMQNTHSLSESSKNSEFHNSLEVDELKAEVCKSHIPSKSAVHTFCVSAKTSCTSVKKTGLGMVVYVGRKHSTRPDSDEEVDIETVEEELSRSPMRKSVLSYRAFSKQMLSVVEDKEILHEVPNVIFATDSERERDTGHSLISSGDARNLEVKCSTVAQSTSVLQHKEELHEVPNVIFSNDREREIFGHKNLCESARNTGSNCSTAVLQASDVDSLLEQFEASEGITSQGLIKAASISPLLEDNVVSADEKAVYSSPGAKKDVSSYIIQKIRMSSAVKKGPILIPPSHQPKSKSRSNSQCGLETSRKSCRSSSSPFPLIKECSSKSTINSKYLFTLDHDHDYCSSSISKIVCEDVEDVKSLENRKGYDKDMNLESACFLSHKNLSSEPGDSDFDCVKKSEEESFIPEAEFEVEIGECHVDSDEETSAKSSLDLSSLHCTSNVHVDTPRASCHALSDRCISNNTEVSRKPDHIGPVTVSAVTALKKGHQVKTSVNCLSKLDTSGSVLLNNQINKTNLRNSVDHSCRSNCSSPGVKRKQDEILTDTISVTCNKKCCSWLASDIQNSSERTLCKEKIDDVLWRRTRSPCVDNNGRPLWKSEKQKQIEERRVVYVGKLPEGLKVNDLRECFTKFGPIQDISIHFRESGDNYGFVTFFNRSDAYEVVERGKHDPKLRRFDLCFGGRRQFCRTRYSDLDSVDEGPFKRSLGETDFDTLLQKAKAGSQYVKQSSTSH